MSDVEDNSADLPKQVMDIIKAAETVIKSLDDETTEQIIELLKTFVIEFKKFATQMSDVEDNSADLPKQVMAIIEYAETVIKCLDDNTTQQKIMALTNILDLLEYYNKGKTTASSSEVSSNENQQEKPVGKIKVLLSKEIGRGANGTIVYEGFHEAREVAVKLLPKSQFNRHLRAEREAETLSNSDEYSQNIRRYYGTEVDKDCIYIALERCDCNLDNLIEMYPKNSSRHKRPLSKGLEKLKKTIGDIKLWNKNTCRPSPLLRDLMRGMVSGLIVLHMKRIVHRDLKPQNILISRKTSREGPALCAKLADMGTSRRLRDTKLALTPHNDSPANRTHGWKAPEELLDGQQTRAMDLFTLGCILFFSITGGKHPFGEQDGNIKDKAYKPDLHLIEDFPEAVDLISSLIKFKARKRPQANKVRHHPLFWNEKKRLDFLRDTSDSVTKESTLSDNKKTTLLSRLESTAKKIMGRKRPRKNPFAKDRCDENVFAKDGYNEDVGWHNKILNDEIKELYPNFLDYYVNGSVKHLLRFIRNSLNHYRDYPREIQEHFGLLDEGLVEGLDAYFTRRFPKLFFEVYKVVRNCCKDDVLFKAYFEGDHEEVTV